MENKGPIKTSRSTAESFIIFLVVVLGVVLGGGLFSKFQNYSGALPTYPSLGPVCCDSGNGAACQPIVDATHPVLTYNNPHLGTQQYGLLKSHITLREGGRHMIDSNQKYTANGISSPIIINSTEHMQGECGGGTQDQLWGPGNKQCHAIPDEEFVYVCKANCSPNSNGGYGSKITVYDVYFRLTDTPSPGVPDFIQNCLGYATIVPPSDAFQQVRLSPVPYPSHTSLQLHTFPFASPPPYVGQDTWFSPYCKPALYLYPPKKTKVSVKIAPQGKLLQTIPDYPSGGWQVMAYPDGQLFTNNKWFDYLYYEASIPDKAIQLGDTGYVIKKEEVSSFFTSLLPQLGLNTKETDQFVGYWSKALPSAPYYAINIVPQSTLDTISPLSISPVPTAIIRVGIYFSLLSKTVTLPKPQLPIVIRNGFTAVEWGGFVKIDKNHSFTCLQ